MKNTFLKTKSNFSLTRKYFPLINFLMINKYKKVWKVISRKPLPMKQTGSQLLAKVLWF